jgi:hypothetical protein
MRPILSPVKGRAVGGINVDVDVDTGECGVSFATGRLQEGRMAGNRGKNLVADDASMPPAAPDPGRALRMSPAQLTTFVVLGGVVVSALAGAYNERVGEAELQVAGMEVQVKYTSRVRFQQADVVSVIIRNATSAVIDSVRVSVDTAYMSGFAEVNIVPEPLFPYVAELHSIPAGETREVRVEARGIRAGTHRGELLVTARADTGRARLATKVLP